MPTESRRHGRVKLCATAKGPSTQNQAVRPDDYCTIRLTVWVCCKDPLVAVMLRVLVPVGVLLLVVTVSVELAVPVSVTGFGLKPALERDGSPDTLSETDPVKPLEGVSVIL